jgi:hypothetical protein
MENKNGSGMTLQQTLAARRAAREQATREPAAEPASAAEMVEAPPAVAAIAPAAAPIGAEAGAAPARLEISAKERALAGTAPWEESQPHPAKARGTRLRPLRATGAAEPSAAPARKPIGLGEGGLANLKGENGWPREMELFAKEELPTIKIPPFDEDGPARRRFLNRLLRFATHEGREDVAVACVKLGAPAAGESERSDGASLFAEIASLSNTPAVDLLLRLGADPNAISGNRTPLMWAAYGPKPVETARALIAAGARINERAHDGKGALTHALLAQNRLFATFLLQNGAEADAQDAEGLSPLALAASLGGAGEELARAILSAGARPDEGLAEGRAALEWAVVHGQERLALALLEAGANASRPARDGRSLAQWARERASESLAERLERDVSARPSAPGPI